MPAPKNPESYSKIFHDLAEFFKKNPMEPLEFSFSNIKEARTFRRDFYGYVTALDRALSSKVREVEEKSRIRMDIHALRARKIRMEENSDNTATVEFFPRDKENLTLSLEEQLQEKERELEEIESEEGQSEASQSTSDSEETQESAMEDTISKWKEGN